MLPTSTRSSVGRKDLSLYAFISMSEVDAANRPVPLSFMLRAHQGVVYRRKA